QNLRFRLAQALADRAALDPRGSSARRRREEEAVSNLQRPITEATLKGFALWLRAALLVRLERFEQAQEALDEAAKAKPAPPAADLLAVRAEILGGRKHFAEAIRAIDTSSLEAPARDALAVHVLLDQWADTPSGSERSAVETALFRRVAALRGS